MKLDIEGFSSQRNSSISSTSKTRRSCWFSSSCCILRWKQAGLLRCCLPPLASIFFHPRALVQFFGAENFLELIPSKCKGESDPCDRIEHSSFRSQCFIDGIQIGPCLPPFSSGEAFGGPFSSRFFLCYCST